MGGADESGVVAIGTLLAGRYRINGMLGSGGMGRVYRCEHTTMDKPVAVKVLHPTLGGDREAAMRFEREALASGRLDHPNIVSVMDFGELDDGRLYLVMEALDGEHLGQWLAREKRIPWADALAIARNVLLGLRHAHDRGVVHRDIKPDNIFLAHKDGKTVVKVLDFGIAKLYADSTDDQAATRAGITVGTPTYLSPEQATGGVITPASDIYSTSIVLYEMLVGRAPFESDDPLTLLTSHVGGDVPAFADLASDLDVPDGLEPLVHRGLAKITAERIGSAEYIQAIDAILRAHSVDVVPTLAARGSRSVGRPLGTLSMPTPFPARTPESASSPVVIRRRRSWVALAIAVVAAAFVVVLLRHGSNAATASTPAPAVASSPPVKESTVSDDNETARQAALHDLQDGATCAERKKALAKLVEIGDAKAVPAIKKARARGKANACLRPAATAAIKTLDGRI